MAVISKQRVQSEQVLLSTDISFMAHLSLLCVLALMLTGIFQPARGADLQQHNYYPPYPKSLLRVGDEDYKKKHLSLSELTGVYVNLDFVKSASKSAGVAVYGDLETQVRYKLNLAGLELYSKTEVEQIPGQPKMDIYPNLPKADILNGTNQHALQCCTAGMWTSFSQGGTVLTQTDNNYRMGTWGEGANTNDCSDLGGWLSRVVLERIDNFVEAYKKAKQEVVVKVEKSKQPLQRMEYPECNTAIMLYAELFETNKVNMSIGKLHILQNVADAMKRCPNFRYLVETHADQRSSDAYNYQLSQRRAETIRSFLLANGVERSQFEVQAFGESQLATTGTSHSDYAMNRRVVITPYKIR